MAKFQARHYVATANVLRAGYEDSTQHGDDEWRARQSALDFVRGTFAAVFELDNPGFDRARFYRECLLPVTKGNLK